MHQVVVDGRSLNYVDYGTSEPGVEPVVFVHGLGGCWQNFLENIPHFARTHRVIAITAAGTFSTRVILILLPYLGSITFVPASWAKVQPASPGFPR